MPALSTNETTLSPSPEPVGSTTLHMQRHPDAVALTGGGWAVVWETHAISGNVPHQATLQLFAADGAAIGGPIQVDAEATGPQAVALADGSVLVAWTERSGADYGEVLAQRYSATGEPLGARVMLNADEPYTQKLLELTPLEGGGFVAFWSSAQQENEGGSPGHGPGAVSPKFVLTAQVFDASGAKVGSSFALTGPVGEGNFPTPQATPMADGGFAVMLSEWNGSAWVTSVQRYDAAGQAVGPEMEVGRGMSGHNSIAGLPDGGFVVAQTRMLGDADVVVQRYASDGTKVFETTLQSDRLDQVLPRVEALPDGGYIVTVVSHAEAASQSAGDSHIYAQRFDSQNQAVGGPVQVDQQGPTGDRVSLAVNDQGVVAVVWGRNEATDGYYDPDVVGRLLTPDMLGAPNPDAGAVLVSGGPGSSLAGGAGDDTLVASAGNDQLTGGGGADRFVLSTEPWAPIVITDFELGVDRLDLKQVFKDAGYAASNPVEGGHVQLIDDGEGGVKVLFDRDGSNQSGQLWPNYIVQLKGVPISQATWAAISAGAPAKQGDLADEPPPPPPPGEQGQVINSDGPGDTLVGGAGNDTLNASQGSDLLTGGGGNDTFAWAREPWSPATVTDFSVGADRLDLSAVFQAAGYAGSDPIADHRIVLLQQGSDTLVLFDDDGQGGAWPNYIIKLQGVSSAGLTWEDLSGGGSQEPPPPPPGGEGQVINSDGPGDTLVGGAGNDTLNASRGSDVLTGAGGADHFAWADEPWSPAEVTDFTPGTDKLDISGLLDDVGYTGADPFGAGYLRLIDDGAGGTKVLFDRDAGGSEPVWPNYIIHLQGVAPGQVTAGDWIFQ